MDTRDTSEGKIKELWGRKFKTVKNGLDEAEVFAFIGNLIEQNKELLTKIEHLDSLTKLAERTIIEAHKQGDLIRKELEEKAKVQSDAIVADAEEKAKAEAARIINEAEQKAEQGTQERIDAAIQQGEAILRAAEEKAESLKASTEKEAKERANNIVAEANQNAAVIEQQAQDTIKKAEEKAESIKTSAEKKANRILADAKEKADDLVKARTASAEKEAQSILKETKAKADAEAQIIKQKAEQLLKRSKKVAESEIREKFKKVYRELLSNLDFVEDTAIIPIAVATEKEDVEPQKPEAVIVEQAEAVTEEPPRKHYIVREEKKEEGAALYKGTVEIVIPPPLSLDRMLQLHKHLRNISQIEVLNLGVSADKSITIRVHMDNPTPLLRILEDLPEVETASDMLQDAETTIVSRKTGEKTPVKRVMVTTKTS